MGAYNFFFIRLIFEQGTDYNIILAIYSLMILLLFDISFILEIENKRMQNIDP